MILSKSDYFEYLNADRIALGIKKETLNPDFPLGDFSYFVESAVIAVAGTGVTCSNGNH